MKKPTIKFRVDTILLNGGIALLPVYLFGSGGIQPTHMLLACFAFISLLVRGLPTNLMTTTLLLLFCYSFFVEAVYTILGGNPKMIIHSVFILYNFVFVSAIYGYCRSKGIGSFLPGFYAAVLIALLTVLSSGVNFSEMVGGRSTGSFNNPNQLGYFSVCLLSLSYLFYREGLIRYIVVAGLFAVAIFLAIASLSKAAMIANFAVAFIALKPIGSRKAVLLWGLGTICAAVTLAVLYQQGAFDQYLFTQRLQNFANENDSSLESRGYFAILEGNAIQMLFGLGNDLVDEIVGHEVHSTVGSYLNNYGIVGLMLVAILLIFWMNQLWRGYSFGSMLSIAGPSMLYGITHNGSRFTIFWLLIAASTAMAQRQLAQRAKKTSNKLHRPPNVSKPVTVPR